MISLRTFLVHHLGARAGLALRRAAAAALLGSDVVHAVSTALDAHATTRRSDLLGGAADGMADVALGLLDAGHGAAVLAREVDPAGEEHPCWVRARHLLDARVMAAGAAR